MTRFEAGEDLPVATMIPNNEESGLNERLIDKESGEETGNFERGEVQERICNDVFFVLLFLAMVIAISVVAGTMGAKEASHVSIAHQKESFRGLMFYVMSSLSVSLGFSLLGLAAITYCTEHIIQGALIFSVTFSLAVGIECSIAGNVFGAILGFITAAFGLCYFCMVQNRVPFATANIKTGSAATRSNAGVFFIGLLFLFISIGFLFVWYLAVFGVIKGERNCDSDGRCHTNINGGLLFLLFLCIFFAQQVFNNCVHVAVAGVVGTWWYSPDEANSCCSPAVQGSLFRTLTSSFGSVCFGSFVVAIIEALRALVESLRNNRDNDGCDQCLLCCLDCILTSIEDMAKYFNKYAFIYVGLYGYSYLEAGQNVSTLFETRGFTLVINDNLVTSALNFLKITIGLMSAGIGILIDRAQPTWLILFHDQQNPLYFTQNETQRQFPAYIISLLGGLIVSGSLFAIIDSAVNTVIVCFAEAPADFDQNHPDHSRNMRQAWLQVYDFEP